MRLIGELLLVTALAIVIGFVTAHKFLVDRLTDAAGSDASPADLADAMLLPFRGAMLAVPFAVAGIILIVIALRRRRPPHLSDPD